jgi:uncharacterized protein (DUF433 family)
MAVLEQTPLTLLVPLREEPARVLRVGKSRVLLELVIHAHQRGTSPQEIVQMYDALALSDVFAVIAYYLVHPAEIDEYLRKWDEEADAVRRKIEAAQRPGPSKEELLARAKAKAINLCTLPAACVCACVKRARCNPSVGFTGGAGASVAYTQMLWPEVSFSEGIDDGAADSGNPCTSRYLA